jgi:hypothetical protein
MVIALLALALLLATAGVAGAQEQQAPKPGPEHELLRNFEGTWDVIAKASFVPGQPASESKGVATNKVALGGFFVIGDFKGQMMGMDFQGHGIHGYDTHKKKYTSVWADSMGSWMMIAEGNYDKATKTLTETCEAPDMTGKLTKYKMVTEFKDRDTHVFTMSWPDDKGKDYVGLTITYKRRR